MKRLIEYYSNEIKNPKNKDKEDYLDKAVKLLFFIDKKESEEDIIKTIKNSNNKEELIDAAEKLKKGIFNRKESITVYNKILKNNPRDLEALHGKLDYLLSPEYRFYNSVSIFENDNTKAKSFCLKILKIYPNDITALRTLASIYNNNGNNEKALLILDKALKHSPRDFELLYDKSNILYEIKNYSEALKFYKLALDLFKKDKSSNFTDENKETILEFILKMIRECNNKINIGSYI